LVYTFSPNTNLFSFFHRQISVYILITGVQNFIASDHTQGRTHAQTHTHTNIYTLGRTLLDKGLARRRDLYRHFAED